MLSNLKSQLQASLAESLKGAFPSHKETLPSIELEIPADKQHGEFSSNIALKSSKLFKKPPMDIAGEFLPLFQDMITKEPFKGKINKIEIKKPGFINFYLTPQALYDILDQIFSEDEDYGRLDFGKKEKVQIEFVSANPTGPLSVAHARQAAVGDALANILNFVGFDAHREYYLNDGGNQIRILGESLKLRIVELLGKTIKFPEDYYQGDYLKEIAANVLEELKRLNPDITAFDEKWLDQWDSKTFENFAKDHILDCIRKELDDFGVHFDFWAYESKIATPEKIEATLQFLKDKGLIYEKDGAQWFKSSDYGDDKDRVVRKSDGSFTYLMPDIAYHKDKFSRGFNRVLDILGPDHHGYIPRIKAAAMALGKKKDDLEVLIVQLATIYRQGQKVSMSTRGGQYISLREVIEEVGVDAARFFFLMRHIKVHLDFDLELAKEQTSENPVYYIQYAHARVHSINAKAAEAKIELKESGFQLLKEEEELDLIKKLGGFSDVLMLCYAELDPYALVGYLQELATGFHRFYDRHRVIDPQNADLSSERLALTNAAKIVFANGLRLLGLSTPKRM